MLEGLSVELTGFLAPVHDDGAPYALQPYLQRESSLSMDLGATHFDTRNPLGGVDRTDLAVNVGGSGNLYLKPWAALFGGLAYTHDDLHDGPLSNQDTHAFSADVGLGLRVRDTRLDLSYGQLARRAFGTFQPLQRGTVRLSLTSVVARRFSLDLTGTSLPAGETGELTMEYFATPRVGIFAGALAGNGELYWNSKVTLRRYQGRAGFQAWFDSTFAASAQYELTIDDAPLQVDLGSLFTYHQVAHTISLQVIARMR
jgi:hypothetical protein